MLSLLSILFAFLLGLFITPLYGVVFAFFAVLLNSPKKILFERIDLFIIIYVAILSLFYLQLKNIPAAKENLIYVIGPFLFYFLGKAVIHSKTNLNKLLFFLTLLLVLYCGFLFFKDASGNLSFNLSQNYYYNSRNKLLIKSELDYSFMNETNLSLLVLTSIYMVLLFVKMRVIKIVLSLSLFSMLLVLASRTAVLTFLVVLFIYFIKYKNLKNKFFILLFTLLLLLTASSIVNVFEIPYISTFFNRLVNESFKGDKSAYGLDTRFIHYFNAYENSQNLFDIKGYKFLLKKYEFSSHNEILGHTSSVGILPAITYITIISTLIISKLKALQFNESYTIYKTLLALTISYIIVGLTENIYLSNTVWIYLLLFIIGLSPNKNYDKKTNTIT